MFRRLLFALILLPCFYLLPSQITTSVRGQVVEGYVKIPLAGAKVTLTHLVQGQEETEEEPISIETDAEGKFSVSEVLAGRYYLAVEMEGYEGYEVENLLLESGKEEVLAVEMMPKLLKLEQVDIRGTRYRRISCNYQEIDVDLTRRVPGVLWDPARLVTRSAAVTQTNDQANHISVRGNSPVSNQWQIEGAEVLSPNHLSNAGTTTDRPAPSGGGTSMLNTQMLDNSTFYLSHYPSRFGNALGGVMDIHFRDGNEQNFEFAAQVGLIGVDLSAEGPLSRHKNGSFLFNYRYSTVGLLSLMGVPLGDEAINYQDFSGKLVQDAGKAGKFTLWGLWGQSFNDFEGVDSIGLATQAKELYNIRFDSRSEMGGLRHEVLLGDRAEWETSFAYSQSTTTWGLLNVPELNLTDSLSRAERDEIQQRLGSLHSEVTIRVGKSANQVRVGGNGAVRSYEGELVGNGAPVTNLDQSWSYFTGLAFVEGEFGWNRLLVSPGLTSQYFSNSNTYHLDPRLSLELGLGGQRAIELSYRRTHQVLPLALQRQFLPTQNQFPLLSQAPIEADQFDLGFGTDSRLGRLSANAYGQLLRDIPMDSSGLAAVNLETNYTPLAFEALTTGRNYGVELTLEEIWRNGFYYMVSGTVFESEVAGLDGAYRPTTWAANYAVKVNGGWEKEGTGRNGKLRTVGIHLRWTTRGGLRQPEVDLDASRLQGQTVFNYADPNYLQVNAFNRLDARFMLQRNRPGYTSTLALDIQNLLNLTNVMGISYDPFLDQLVDRTSLGIIPVLSYRMQFN